MLKLSKTNKQVSGFTIIEVALVLAIAAMIFLSVFLAVPALQRNQRDDARKRDVSNVVAAIEAYYANSGNGALTGEVTIYDTSGPRQDTQLGPYLGQLSKNIDAVNVTSDGSHTKMDNQGRDIMIVNGKQCGEGRNLDAASPRSAAVVVQLEAGNPNYAPDRSGSKYYCQDAS